VAWQRPSAEIPQLKLELAESEQTEPATKAAVFVIFPGCRSSQRFFFLLVPGQQFDERSSNTGPRVSGKFLRVPGTSIHPH
jgi:hypothetical protein